MSTLPRLPLHSLSNPVHSQTAKRRLLAPVAVTLFVLTLLPGAQALIFRTSQMDGFATGNLGAVGGAEGWDGSSGQVTVTSGSGSLDGTALGLVPSAGDKADISATTGFTTRNVFVNASTFPVNRATNVYYSFLYRMNNAADVDAAGELVFQVNRQNSGSAAHFMVIARNVGGQIELGVNKPGGTPAYSPRKNIGGETLFVVLRQQMIVGASDDIIELWINPPAVTLGLDESSVPLADAFTTDGTEDTSNTGPGRFYLASGANAAFDEFRVATTWAEVTPTPAICIPAMITEHPTDVSLTAGVNTTLVVAGDGTAPTYRWQVSHDGGASWDDASGGSGLTSPTYTTPNLFLSDDGVHYRCVVSVTCDSSSATSAVAAVTVVPPVPTPQGVVLEDTWDDLDRSTGPVTPSNSVWFASSSGSLIFIGDLLYGQPASSSSRLWIGYFTDDTETNLPVHLDVGKSIKATWTWNSTQIVATDGNLRIGLFDYADGGTRVTGDNFGSGSTGNGVNVRGYMLTMDYAQVFTDDTPFNLRARTVLGSPNLMGSSGDFPVSLANGPTGMLNAPAFQDYTNYTVELIITRTAENSVDLTASISGGGTNWTVTATDDTYAYHRFDAFAIRPASLETTAFDFEFGQFKVEVLQAPAWPIPLGIARSGNDIILTWSDPRFVLQAAPTVTGTYTNVSGATSPHSWSIGSAPMYFRLRAE